MINKRTFLIAFAVCSAYFLQAQEVSKTAISTPKNEFSIGIGYYTNHKSFDDMPSMELDRSSPLYEYNSGKYTLSEIRQTLSVDIAYHYHLSNHWALGAQAAWQHTTDTDTILSRIIEMALSTCTISLYWQVADTITLLPR